MSKRLLQFDFPMRGPFGDEMAVAHRGLAESIATEPGLIWKIWTENKETGEGGGIYLFEDDETAQAYLAMHTARLESFGVTNIRARVFDVNETLSRIDHAPIGDPLSV